MSTDSLKHTTFKSGCFLSDTQQVVVRESTAPDTPPILYGLTDQFIKQLKPPFFSRTSGSEASAISPSICVSCGGVGAYKSGASRIQLKECFEYNAKSNSTQPEWTPIAPLPRRLAYGASVSLGGDYYFIGGYYGFDVSEKEKLLYRYDSKLRRWYRESAAMSAGRAAHSAAALSSTEFIVCGGHPKRDDCEIYNNRNNTWRLAARMNTGRQWFSMVNYGGGVYAMGGIGRKNAYLNSVEVYDAMNDSWSMVKKSLKYARRYFLGVVV